MGIRRALVVWVTPAILALVGACAKPLRDADLTLESRPEVAIRLPYVEPAKAMGEANAIRQTSWDEKPEKLPPPRAEKDGKAGEKTDPPPPVRPGQRVTLEQAILLCLQADPKLRAGVEDIAQAQADLVTASLKPNPTLDVSATLLPLFRAFRVDRQGGPPQLDVFVSYPIDWCLFGKQAAAVASANLGVHVSEYDYANAVRERVREVAVAFYDALEARALLGLARQDVSNLKRIEATLEKAVKAGGKAAVDLNRIRLDRLRSEQAAREAEAAYNVARVRLLSYLGRTDRDPDFDVEGSLEGALPGGEVSADEAFAAAQENRPDIRAARADVAKSQADVEVEDRNAYPEVTPRVGYQHQFQRAAIGFPDADAWGMGVTMTLPCHNRNQGNRIKARSRVAQKNLELHARLVELRAEVERAVVEYRTAQANARALAGDQLRLAADVRDAIDRAYQAGGRSLLDLLDAQRNYRETYRLYLTSRANYYRAVNRLQNATGAGVHR